MKILIIEDEPEIISLLTQWLSERGHEPVGITGGADAESWVQKQGFELVLLDIKLPDSNGLELISSIAKAGAKVVVMSGLPRETWMGQAMWNGASDCLTKPLDLKHLERILERFEQDA